MGILAVVLGITSLYVWFVPMIGFPIGIASTVCGVMAKRDFQSKLMSYTGIIGGSLCLVLSLVNGLTGAIWFPLFGI